MRTKRTAVLGFILTLAGLTGMRCASPGPQAARLDPESRQFLDMIGYIILPVEEKIFREMPSEDRGEFIRDFWARRDPDPATEENEYRSTYYQRLQIADKAFGRGSPGWKTDRGRIYILLGQPTNIITKTMGDSPNPNNFFGTENLIDAGTLTERPTEIWLYDNYTEYFAGPLRLVFVDFHSTGDFKLQTKEKITAFSMVSPTFDPPDLAKYQWIGEIEQDEQTPGKTAIFDYDAGARVEKERDGAAVRVWTEIPFKRLEYDKSGDEYILELMLAAEVRDSRNRILTKHDEPYSQTLPFQALQDSIAGDLRIRKEWTLALPEGARAVILSVTDLNKGRRLRKLLELK